MPNPIIATNRWIGKRVVSARALLNSGLTLHLFQNDPTIDAASVDPAIFTECDFDTYAPVDLTAAFRAGSYVQDGEYQTEAGPFAWPPPATVGNTVFGWWVDDGMWVQLAYKFAVPILVAPGGDGIDFLIRFQTWAAFLL